MTELYAVLFHAYSKATAARKRTGFKEEDQFYRDNVEPGWWTILSFAGRGIRNRFDAPNQNSVARTLSEAEGET